MNTNDHIRILLIQQFFPAYRIPVFSKLASHPSIDFTLLHGISPSAAPGEVGLQNVSEDMPFRVIKGPIPQLRCGTKALLWFNRAIELVKNQMFDVVIHNFAIRWASLNRTRKLQQAKGGKFILWGIGFSQMPTPVMDRLRLRMVRQAEATILYSTKDRQKYIELGAPSNKLFVARNCVDFPSIESAICWWTRDRLQEFRRKWKICKGPVLLSVGRLAENKRLDMLVRAASLLRSTWKTLKVVFIGNGPHKVSLQHLSQQLGLGHNVLYPGAITNEREIAPWFLSSDAVIAPGQIGLLAIHAAAYGRPLVTGDNPVMYGPEVEAFIPGTTGLAYSYGDEHALAEAIAHLLSDTHLSEKLGLAANRHIRKKYGVGNMANGVLMAVSHVTGCPLEAFEPYP